MSLEYIRDYYKVPARRGGRVVVDGKPGEVIGASGPYLSVRRDGETETVRAHPTWRVEYVEDGAE